MRSKVQARLRSEIGWQFLERLAHVRNVGGDELRMIEPAVDEGHVDVAAVRSQRLLRGRDILAVLLTARVRVMSGSDETNRMPHAIRVHLLQRVRQQRMPVAHADVDGQRTAGGVEAFAETVRLATRQLRQRRYAIEQLVMVRDFFNALRRNSSSAQHVGEEGADVVAPLRTAEGDDKDCVEYLQSSSI